MKQKADGAPFEVAQRSDRAVLTAAVIDAGGKPILFSNDGVRAGP